MLSILPAACSPFASSQGCLGKRPLPSSCLGDYHSSLSRAKRLRQELLRLREWEQHLQQEALGAYEGSGDSCDESVCVEPSDSLLSGSGAAGCLPYIEDSSDSTSSPVHESPSSLQSPLGCSHFNYAHPYNLDVATSLAPLIPRRTASNPVDLQPSSFKAPVYTQRTLSLPQNTCTRSAVLSALNCVQEETDFSLEHHPLEQLQQKQEDNAEEDEDGDWNGASCDLSGSGNPLLDFVPVAANDAASVQFSRDHTSDCDILNCDVESDSGCHVDIALREDPPREETSVKHVSPAKYGASACVCKASDTPSLVLPPLPSQFLGMPMHLRLRLLEFFVQGTELLGLGVKSLYLAASLLDCYWVETSQRRNVTTRAALASAPALSALGRPELHLTACVCLYHAYISELRSPPARMEAHFVHLLMEASAQFPRVRDMLPLRATALEETLANLQELLPLAVAQSSLSSSSLLYGSMLELRGICTQKEHLVVFISELCAVGFMAMPLSIVCAANCCLLTGAVHVAHAESNDRTEGKLHHHHHHHFEAMQGFLCSDCCVPAPHRERMDRGLEKVEACCNEEHLPEPSLEISI